MTDLLENWNDDPKKGILYGCLGWILLAAAVAVVVLISKNC
jgi:hypothetical protein